MLLIQTALTFLPAGLKDLRGVAGILAIVVGIGTLEIAAISRPPSSAGRYAVFAFLVLPLGSLALGGACAAMLLGHWYLVTPKLSPGPRQTAATAGGFAVGLHSI